MTRFVEIEQDHEAFDDDIGSPMDVFWAKGHGHDPADFIRSVVEHCLDYGRSIPRIPDDLRPVEMWQRNVPSGDCIVYHRYAERPAGRGASRGMFPVTVLDVDGRRSGATKCSVNGCENPWMSGRPVAAKVDMDETYTAVTLWFCRKHGHKFPEPSYRVCMVPVGATIVLEATR